MTSNWLQDQVCLVTGGGSGIGRAVVQRYLSEGATGVVVLDRDCEKIRKLQHDFVGRLIAIEGDVREYEAHEQAVAAAIDNFGRLDVVVANAGVFDFRRPLISYSADVLRQTMDELFSVNLRGYLYIALASHPHLLKTKGSLIFTASVASFHAAGGGILYTMSKHAVLGLVRRLALEMAPEIRVNGIGPGATLTSLSGTQSLNHASRSINSNGDLAEKSSRALPLGFVQEPEDHTGLYVLLASRINSRAITGEVFMSDGGVGIRSI